VCASVSPTETQSNPVRRDVLQHNRVVVEFHLSALRKRNGEDGRETWRVGGGGGEGEREGVFDQDRLWAFPSTKESCRSTLGSNAFRVLNCRCTVPRSTPKKGEPSESSSRGLMRGSQVAFHALFQELACPLVSYGAHGAHDATSNPAPGPGYNAWIDGPRRPDAEDPGADREQGCMVQQRIWWVFNIVFASLV
jgi:hypothetical protein